MPLPSLFFIGKNGTPIEIVTGITKTVDELNSKIDGVLNGVKPKASDSNSATASANLIASKVSTNPICQFSVFNWIKSNLFLGEQSTSNEEDTEIVCENGVCFKRPKENKTEAASTESTTSDSTTQLANEERLKRAKDLIEKKRKDKEEEDGRVSWYDECEIILQWQKSHRKISITFFFSVGKRAWIESAKSRPRFAEF